MPRPNQPRSIGREQALARRIAHEREVRGWSNEGLASRMTKVGCSMAASAVYKIENLGRRITVDELVAFSQVFETPIDNLLLPPELAVNERLAELAGAWDEAYRAMGAAQDRVRDAWEALRSYVQSGAVDESALEVLGNAFGDAYHSASDMRDLEVARFLAEVTGDDEWKARHREQVRMLVKQAGLD